MWVPEKNWHALTHSVFQLAGAVRDYTAILKRMEINMSEQGDQLKSVVDALSTTVDGIDSTVKGLNEKVAALSAAGTPVDPAVAEQIARLSGLNTRLQGDLPAVAVAADAAAPAAPAADTPPA